MFRSVCILVLLFLFAPAASAHSGDIVVTPPEITQGEPVLIVVEGIDIRDIKKLTFGGRPVPVFEFEGEPTALIAIDLSARTGVVEILVETNDGDKVRALARILPRRRIVAPMGIPEKMGGNTRAGANNLVRAIVNENRYLSTIISTREAPRFDERFRFPLATVEVTDDFGYSRKTGTYNITHRGTDFRAATGTPIYALNDGVVRISGDLIAYGKTVVIDHGSRIMSYSLHLSKVFVRQGQLVKKGETIGLSGDSGYALEPHLHLSIKINGTSVDPMKFFALLGEKTAEAAAR